MEMGVTTARLWIPLYPLYPAKDMYDGVKFGYELHRKMLETYEPERIVWIGYSAGAVLVMGLGRHIAHKNYELPMPGVIVAVTYDSFTLEKDKIDHCQNCRYRSNHHRSRIRYYAIADPACQEHSAHTHKKYDASHCKYLFGPGFPLLIIDKFQISALLAGDQHKSQNKKNIYNTCRNRPDVADV